MNVFNYIKLNRVSFLTVNIYLNNFVFVSFYCDIFTNIHATLLVFIAIIIRIIVTVGSVLSFSL